LFFIGLCPAILAVPMAVFLREPESWQRAKALAAGAGGGKSVGAITDLFVDPRWRHNMLSGVCLGVAGMVGLWAIAFYSPELITMAFKNRPLQSNEVRDPARLCLALKEASNPALTLLKARLSPLLSSQLDQLPPGSSIPPALTDALVQDLNRVMQSGSLYDPTAFKAVQLKRSTMNLAQRLQSHPDSGEFLFLNRQLLEQLFPGAIYELQRTIDRIKSKGTLLQDIGALLGMFTFTFVAARFSRRAAFLGSFVLCMAVVSFVFYSLKTAADAYWMLPMVGFATLSCFAGYSIYFPELFPTRLRGTGVGFCYNTVRYLAAPFPFLLTWLSSLGLTFRSVAVGMSSIYLLGVVALLWAPETKGKPLPED
jgi:hypothetical protein